MEEALIKEYKISIMKQSNIILLCLINASIVLSQTYNSDSSIITQKSLDTENKQLNVLQNQSLNRFSNNQLNQGNSVFIKQVGFKNEGTVDIISDDSSVNLLQIGYKNVAEINLRAATIRENVVQIGTNNVFQDYSIHGAQLHKADVLQGGSYNTIISTGQNSLSEKIQIIQKGIGREAYIIHN
ncbi:hypothetical protein AAU57_08180 [Nonlabens sp. YIK11]|uniref:hypothetical protein n=1 Tax=Nonlabens sp. YIK11 TaxID=1453349 RepID=UPI0006DC9A03|nr:hypothetical protein [Nonlabens sp. YIK11]KQC33299.1 hypothetical protein AAU57_08180 [Nonlabens sp. YIK11]